MLPQKPLFEEFTKLEPAGTLIAFNSTFVPHGASNIADDITLVQITR